MPYPKRKRGYNLVDRLPSFDLSDYTNLLDQLRESGYQFRTVSQMRDQAPGRFAYIRHDVDLHLSLVSTMANLEKSRDIRTTYFVPLTLHFNPLYPPNQDVLKQLYNFGHEVGLHYDLETYPNDFAQAREHLDWEVGILQKLTGQPVHSICMHQPYKGQSDLFCEIDAYVHPSDPRYQQDLLYVSDSCRAWRDENLLRCFSPSAPCRLLLTIHPELWLDGRVVDRMEYLHDVLMVHGVRQHSEYFGQNVRQVWSTHPAPMMHDEREYRRTSTY